LFSEKPGLKKAGGSSAELESTAFDRENSDESSLRNHKKKGTQRVSSSVPMVAGACNAPKALVLPFRYLLPVSGSRRSRYSEVNA
jgi:hypothetical protein